MQIHSVGIDLGKTTFHLVALGAAGKVLVRKKFSQQQPAGVHREHADGIDMARSRVADHGSEVVEGSSFSSWVAQAGSRCVLRVRHFRMGCDRLAIQRSLPRVESYSPAIRSRTPHGPRWGSQ
jgi:hypothetical protein